MALPQTGAISFYDLNIDMGRSGTAALDINTAALHYSLSTPHSMSEFYGSTIDYSISANTSTVQTSSTAKTITNAVTITSQQPWTSSITTGFGWLSINPVSGSGNGSFNVIVNNHTDFENNRQGVIRISNAQQFIEIGVTQLAQVDTVAPTAPTLVYIDKTVDTISLSWNSATDNRAVTSYKLYNLTTSQVFTLNSSTVSYTDTNLNGGTSYSYVVKALDAAGNESVASNTITQTTNTASANVDLSIGYSTASAAYSSSIFGGYYYHNGAGQYPTNLDNIYTDINGNNAYNGGMQWFRILNTSYVLRIDSTGVVLDRYDMSQTLSVSPTSSSRTSAAGSFTANVTSNSTWVVSESLSWVSYTGASGTGNDSFTISLTANSGAQRSGTVTIRTTDYAKSVTINITQAGAQATIYAHQLSQGSDSVEACSGFKSTYYTDSSFFASSTKIYTDSAGNNLAFPAYYSNGNDWLWWDSRNGGSIRGQGFCGAPF